MKRSPALAFGLAAAAVVTCSAVARALAASAYSFRNKVAVITGGSRGLGLALARVLASEGARLAILARDEAELERAAADLRARDAEVFTARCDVCDDAQVQRAITEVMQRFGAIDVLVNNAGEIAVGPLSTMTREDFADAMAIHFWAPLNMILAALPHMMRQGGGRIVNVASFGGKVAVPHLAPYCASKFALVGLSDSLRAELAKDDIRVTTVCPGLMRTGSHLNASFKGDRHREEFTWFSIGASQPLFSINADRAARQIAAACKRGQPELVITLQARLMVLSQALFPNLTARAIALADRFLPKTTSAEAKEKWTGWESRSDLSPSLLTRLADRATEKLNGLRGHTPIAPK